MTEAVEVALEILRESGADKLSLRRVAEGIGVSHAALYRHFDDRDSLLDRLAVRGFRELGSAVARVRSVRGFVSAYVEFALAQPALYDVMMSRQNERLAIEGPLREASQALIMAARTAFGKDTSDDDIIKTWMILHGGIGLRTVGMMQPLSDGQFVKLLSKMVDA